MPITSIPRLIVFSSLIASFIWGARCLVIQRFFNIHLTEDLTRNLLLKPEYGSFSPLKVLSMSSHSLSQHYSNVNSPLAVFFLYSCSHCILLPKYLSGFLQFVSICILVKFTYRHRSNWIIKKRISPRFPLFVFLKATWKTPSLRSINENRAGRLVINFKHHIPISSKSVNLAFSI